MVYELLNLPNNCLFTIFSYLEYKYYWNLAYLCSNKLSYICKHVSYKFIDKEHYSYDFIQKYWEPLHIGGVKSDILSRYYFGPNVHINDLDINTPYFIDSMKYIENLILVNPLNFDNENIIRHDYEHRIKYIIHNIPYLRKFTIEKHLYIKPDDTCLFNSLPYNIHTVNLSGVRNMTDNLIDILTQHTPNIRELILNGAIESYITDKSIYYLRDRCRNIEICNLYGCTLLTDISMEYIGDIKTLHKLTLDWCVNITDNGISILVQRNPKLTHLSLQCMNIGRASVNSMVEYLNSPIYINISYTNCIYMSLVSLRKKCKLLISRKA